MIHMTGISVSPKAAIAIRRPTANLGQVVREQFGSMTAAGYGEVDVCWSADMLVIEGKGDRGHVRRKFNTAGACVAEQVDQQGISVKREFSEDGITLISEEISSETPDC